MLTETTVYVLASSSGHGESLYTAVLEAAHGNSISADKQLGASKCTGRQQLWGMNALTASELFSKQGTRAGARQSSTPSTR